MTAPEELLRFWLDEVGPAKWYIHDPALDSAICEEFMGVWEQAMEGKFSLWLTYPSGALAYCILLDQFSRNMFRGQSKAFEADELALKWAQRAISNGYDMGIPAPSPRMFFYLPFEHSEDITVQNEAVRLFDAMGHEDYTKYAVAHQKVIEEFGRFPHRNAVLGRINTKDEELYLSKPGAGF